MGGKTDKLYYLTYLDEKSELIIAMTGVENRKWEHPKTVWWCTKDPAAHRQSECWILSGSCVQG